MEAVRGYPCLWMLTEKGYKDGKHVQEHESHSTSHVSLKMWQTVDSPKRKLKDKEI